MFKIIMVILIIGLYGMGYYIIKRLNQLHAEVTHIECWKGIPVKKRYW